MFFLIINKINSSRFFAAHVILFLISLNKIIGQIFNQALIPSPLKVIYKNAFSKISESRLNLATFSEGKRGSGYDACLFTNEIILN